MIFWCPLSPNTNDDRPAPGSADKLVHLARLYSQGLCIFGINASMAARRGSASLASSALRRPSTRIIMQNIHIGLYCHAGCLRSLSKGPQVLQRGFISVNGLSEKVRIQRLGRGLVATEKTFLYQQVEFCRVRK